MSTLDKYQALKHKPSRRLKKLQAQLIAAEATFKKYSEGGLSDIEIQMGCNRKKIAESWKGSVERLKIEIKNEISRAEAQ